jgi:hypothetical protein
VAIIVVSTDGTGAESFGCFGKKMEMEKKCGNNTGISWNTKSKQKI